MHVLQWQQPVWSGVVCKQHVLLLLLLLLWCPVKPPELSPCR
jgi:hypothetical protein